MDLKNQWGHVTFPDCDGISQVKELPSRPAYAVFGGGGKRDDQEKFSHRFAKFCEYRTSFRGDLLLILLSRKKFANLSPDRSRHPQSGLAVRSAPRRAAARFYLFFFLFSFLPRWPKRPFAQFPRALISFYWAKNLRRNLFAIRKAVPDTLWISRPLRTFLSRLPSQAIWF